MKRAVSKDLIITRDGNYDENPKNIRLEDVIE